GANRPSVAQQVRCAHDPRRCPEGVGINPGTAGARSVNALDFAALNDALNADAVVPQWLPGGELRRAEYVVATPTRN
ncbi:hypothetical protein RSW49_24820, partial [Escherichia coli]|uniref:hypothetical protein n=1 Tax=Escherichia coli TaxID=562 RepID=UPI0028DDC54C